MLFFSEFSFLGRVWTEFETKFFFSSFSAYLFPFWLKILPKRGFLNFWVFLLFFFQNFHPRVEYERNLELKFFFSFLAYLFPFWLKIMPERGFLDFWILLLFIFEFSSPGRLWTEFGTIIFFLSFSAYLIPFLLKIMPERGFLIFWIDRKSVV